MKSSQFRRVQYKKGFIAPLLLALIAVLLIGGGAYMYVQKNQTNQLATGQTAAVNPLAPIITSVATSTDSGPEPHSSGVNIIISGSNLVDRSIVEYLNNGKVVDGFCGYLVDGVLKHSWGQPENGWAYYSNINEMKVINADCRTGSTKSDYSNYPTSATVSIRMIGNPPTPKATSLTPNSQTAGWKTFATTTASLISYNGPTDTNKSFSFQYPTGWSVCKKISLDTEYVTVSDNCGSVGGKPSKFPTFPTNYFEIRNIGALEDSGLTDTGWKIIQSDSTNGAEPMRAINYQSKNITLVLVGSDSDMQSTLDKIASTFKINP